jgi:acyl-CoA thioester hydrolase
VINTVDIFIFISYNKIHVQRYKYYIKKEKIMKKTYIRNAKYYETDQMGVIHHSNYIKWLEETRVEMMHEFGISYKEMEKDGIICPVLSVSCQYKSMVHFDDTVEIKPIVAKYNGIKFELEYEITDLQTGELRTTATSSHCFLNREGRPISLKRDCPEIHEKFQKMAEILK